MKKNDSQETKKEVQTEAQRAQQRPLDIWGAGRKMLAEALNSHLMMWWTLGADTEEACRCHESAEVETVRLKQDLDQEKGHDKDQDHVEDHHKYQEKEQDIDQHHKDQDQKGDPDQEEDQG